MKESIEDNVEELANNYANQFEGTDCTTADVDFIAGYNKAKETYKYTREDIAKLISELAFQISIENIYEPDSIIHLASRILADIKQK
jgi:hypothetical protein